MFEFLDKLWVWWYWKQYKGSKSIMEIMFDMDWNPLCSENAMKKVSEKYQIWLSDDVSININDENSPYVQYKKEYGLRK